MQSIDFYSCAKRARAHRVSDNPRPAAPTDIGCTCMNHTQPLFARRRIPLFILAYGTCTKLRTGLTLDAFFFSRLTRGCFFPGPLLAHDLALICHWTTHTWPAATGATTTTTA